MFSSPCEAEKHYLPLRAGSANGTQSQEVPSPQTVICQNPSVSTSSDPVSSCRVILSPFTSEERLKILDELLVECAFSLLVKIFFWS